MRQVLLVNPPIYDFTAYDLWSKPLGLLYLSSILKSQKVDVTMLDYLDRHFYGQALSNKYGCGHFIKEKISKPDIFENVPRYYSRFGIKKEEALNFLKNITKPDIILITSIMTYWYPGVAEVIETIRSVFPGTPIAVGGVYATLCPNHLANFKPDFIVKGSLASLESVLAEAGISVSIPKNFSDFPLPDYSCYDINEYVSLRYSLGCPLRCTYCAQDILCNGQFDFKNPKTVYNEIEFFYNQGIKNFAFYDDALFYKADEGIKPLLKQIVENNLNINIHTPNGLHVKYLDEELAILMKKAGFISPRFSLESSNIETQIKTGAKVTNEDFEKAINMLQKAGYKKGEYTAYLLFGMPGQALQETKESVKYLHSLGAKSSLSEYSIIPGTKDFEKVDTKFKEEPLLHNKTAFPMYSKESWNEIQKIKWLARKLNASLSG